MSTTRHTTSNRIATLAIAAALITLPTLARATEDHFDLEGDTWGVPLVSDSLRIVINVPARRLTLVEGRTFVKSYPVAVGRAWTPTPRGNFEILQKAKDPTWAPKGRPVVPPGPANPLGRRWMRISPDGYGIHATNDPGSIGKVRSHGCIRMNPADASDLFDRVPLGTPVTIVYDLSGYDGEGQPEQYADVYSLRGPQ